MLAETQLDQLHELSDLSRTWSQLTTVALSVVVRFVSDQPLAHLGPRWELKLLDRRLKLPLLLGP